MLSKLASGANETGNASPSARPTADDSIDIAASGAKKHKRCGRIYATVKIFGVTENARGAGIKAAMQNRVNPLQESDESGAGSRGGKHVRRRMREVNGLFELKIPGGKLQMEIPDWNS